MATQQRKFVGQKKKPAQKKAAAPSTVAEASHWFEEGEDAAVATKPVKTAKTGGAAAAATAAAAASGAAVEGGKTERRGSKVKEAEEEFDLPEDLEVSEPDEESDQDISDEVNSGEPGSDADDMPMDDDDMPMDDDGTESSISDEDVVGPRTRVGDVPRSWYDDLPHVGYDVEGNPVIKKKMENLGKLLQRIDDPAYYRTVIDWLNQEEKVLSDRDLEIIDNLTKGRFPEPEFNPYEEHIHSFVEWKDGHKPFYRDPSKRSFIPNTWEHRQVWKMVTQIRAAEREGRKPWGRDPHKDINQPRLIWDENVDPDPEIIKRRRWHLPVQKQRLPGHAESYNSAPEYDTQRFDALRHVPFYGETIRERYQRCLDLFYATRKLKTRVHVDPNSLLPDLPSPDDLRPYPCRHGFEYKGHTSTVHSISPSPDGQWLATGCADGCLRVFEVNTGRLMYRYRFAEPVVAVEFNPNPAFCQVTCAAGNTMYLIAPRACSATERPTQFDLPDAKLFPAPAAAEDDLEEKEKTVEWRDPSEEEQRAGVIIKCVHHAKLSVVRFHHKGDYVATVAPKDIKKRVVSIHILSKRSTINPFKKAKETAKDVAFGVKEPTFYIMTTHTVKVYHLIKQQVRKKFKGTVNNMSCMAVHSTDDHVLCGSSDRPSMWFDIDFGEKPYRKLSSHTAGIRGVAFHPRPHIYPLFATVGDDGSAHIYHGRVYDDLTQNTLIVPLKVIKAHTVIRYVGVCCTAFHPTQPWLFTGGADHAVRLWVE